MSSPIVNQRPGKGLEKGFIRVLNIFGGALSDEIGKNKKYEKSIEKIRKGTNVNVGEGMIFHYFPEEIDISIEQEYDTDASAVNEKADARWISPGPITVSFSAFLNEWGDDVGHISKNDISGVDSLTKSGSIITKKTVADSIDFLRRVMTPKKPGDTTIPPPLLQLVGYFDGILPGNVFRCYLTSLDISITKWSPHAQEVEVSRDLVQSGDNDLETGVEKLLSLKQILASKRPIRATVDLEFTEGTRLSVTKNAEIGKSKTKKSGSKLF